MANTIILTTCSNTTEAYLIKGTLENNGINCFLTNENFSNLMPHYFNIMGAGIQVMIDESDLEKAQELISSPSKADEILCPNCNSSNVTFGFGYNKVKKWVIVFLSLFSWVPFGNIKKNFRCEDCKTEFEL
jgi:DNA-directed RNA polymerase subunit RPC12/RpoP